MSRDQAPGAAPDELGRLLRRLGQEPLASELGEEDERVREARVAERIEIELTSLVRARRAARGRYFAAAAAASFLLAAGSIALHRADRVPDAIGPETLPNPTAKTLPIEVTKTIAPPRAAASVSLPRTEPRRPRVEREAVAPPPESAPLVGSAPEGALSPDPAHDTSSAGGSDSASTLARENQLFREAAEAARGGDAGRALARLDRLLLDHPTSPLAQTALVRKFRLLLQTGRAREARTEAAHYLARYPTGFAVGEARAVAAAPAGAGTGGHEENAP
jgi:hypothetical protein